MTNNECKNVHHLLDLALRIMEVAKEGADEEGVDQGSDLGDAIALFGTATQMSVHTTKPNEFVLLKKTNLAFAFNNFFDYQRAKKLIYVPLDALKKVTGEGWESVADDGHFEIWLKPENEPHWIENKYER